MRSLRSSAWSPTTSLETRRARVFACPERSCQPSPKSGNRNRHTPTTPALATPARIHSGDIGILPAIAVAPSTSGDTSKPAIKGHFKTGHFRTARDTRFIPYRKDLRQEEIGMELAEEPGGNAILTMPRRRIGLSRNGTRAPLAVPERRGGTPPPPVVLARKRKIPGVWGLVPMFIKTPLPHLPFSLASTVGAAVLVRKLRGPHMRTCPWCSRRSSIALTAATSPSSLPQSSTGRFDVSNVLARS